MISNHLNAVRAKQAESARIEEAMADFWTRPGTSFKELPSARMKPKPPRSNKIDPETVLKRRPKPISAPDRRALRKMADAI
ncbi:MULTISPECIES: hypothetical protein [Pseudomonas]|uniref:Uncharacterized protein n=1 Tax=Pseudomonas fluorescens TaxID=294 RepID=A0A120FY25_PSEFL|nr:hypothetical protein [Pseudomonas fluorescens]KWV72404.1 hypothetical protein PFL603g_04097 [Pseudomonas fluorescens]